MRTAYLLLLGVSIAAATVTVTPFTAKTVAVNDTSTKHATSKKKEEPAAALESRQIKALKVNSENRGKRTLYDFGNAGYLYGDVASRRAGYIDGSSSSNLGDGYYHQSGFYDGQSAIAQFPSNFVHGYAPYPQYLEAPEPIIEIIIKDANETLAEVPPQPIVTKTKKKKKEKVHVFYVNYKKDQNNKLHLETPIASLNNDDTDTDEQDNDEEEEIIQYPATPLPPLRSTTLRTIIHPDSEKYHSNSGIHVSFGAEDKSQIGHILEEHDAESIQRQVVALPASSGIKNDGFVANTRADYGRNGGFGQAPASNLIFNGNGPTHSYQHLYPVQQQQLPTQHASNYFRPPAALIGLPPPIPTTQKPLLNQQQHQQQLQQQQQYYNKQQQQVQRPNNAPTATSTQSIFSKLLQQSQYYINHNQQYAQPPPSPQQQQQQQKQTYYKPQTAGNKPVPFFPTPVPSKTQELPIRQQPPAAYQPIKFRPTPAPAAQIKPVPIPVKLDNVNYQQQHYQQQQQQQQQQQHTPKQHISYQFNRQPQFVQQPVFMVQSPTPQSQDYYHSQQQPQQQQRQQQQQQKLELHKYQTNPQAQIQTQTQTQTQPQTQSQSHSQAHTQSQDSSNLGGLHKYFDIQPSRETELLKAIPKFEQHITETVHNPIGQQEYHQQQPQQQYDFGSTRQQVIHDIPAPNLGPNALQTPIGGHYITATQQQQQQQQQQQTQINQQHQQQQQFTNFVTSGQTGNTYQRPTATAAPIYAESTHGQKVMVVTPLPPHVYTQYNNIKDNHNNNNNNNNHKESIYAVHSPSTGGDGVGDGSAGTLQVQTSLNFAQQPRQSLAGPLLANDNSPYSVSTYHSDVFKELEQRKPQQQSQQQQQLQQQSTVAATATASTQLPHHEPNKIPKRTPTPTTATATITTTTTTPPSGATSGKAKQTLLQLPDEVPDDLRHQLFSSGILNNADISVLDYDKVGDIALENLPAEHLQHFYGAGGGAQIAETNKVVSVVKPNGDKVALSEKDIERVKQSNTLPQKQNLDVKVVRYDAQQEKSVGEKYLKSDATIVPPVDLGDRQYNRYLPLKLNGAQFPIPESDELLGKRVVSVVVLAPVEQSTKASDSASAARAIDNKEVKFLSGELIKTLVKKPTKENFKRWLEKEARTDLELQSVVLLVAKSTEVAANAAEQEIFMYDIATGAINKLNGELSSTFVNVAEENASSEDLEHAATLDQSSVESMMHRRRR